MADAYVGEIRLFAGSFAPRNWAFCEGQLLLIAQNTSLFSLLGTVYGGNGQSTFALPDLRDRAPIHWGQGPGTSLYDLGEVGGEAFVTLKAQEMPAHNHIPQGSTGLVGTSEVKNNVWASGGRGASPLYGKTPDTPMAPTALGLAGEFKPHHNQQPYLGVNYIICLFGIFPSRD